MSSLLKYLHPNKLKLQSKGITSVQSRVINLKELVPSITVEKVEEAFISSFSKVYKGADVSELQLKDLQLITEWKEYHKQLSDWNWRFGSSPHFSYSFETKFPWGIVEVNLESDKGVISACKIYSDTLYPEVIETVQKKLEGKRYNESGIMEAIHEAQVVLIGISETESSVMKQHCTELGEFILKHM